MGQEKGVGDTRFACLLAPNPRVLNARFARFFLRSSLRALQNKEAVNSLNFRRLRSSKQFSFYLVSAR